MIPTGLSTVVGFTLSVWGIRTVLHTAKHHALQSGRRRQGCALVRKILEPGAQVFKPQASVVWVVQLP
jgi:hypothetical protein